MAREKSTSADFAMENFSHFTNDTNDQHVARATIGEF